MPSPDEKRVPPQGTQSVVQLGLRANWQQFTLLVIVNAFVGGMVGLERSIVPLLGQRVFGLASTTAVLSFIVSFGVVKALANLFAGRLSDRIGRKDVLVAGWLVGLPVPLLIIFAPSWGWVVFANVLLGINQGLCWSTTVSRSRLSRLATWPPRMLYAPNRSCSAWPLPWQGSCSRCSSCASRVDTPVTKQPCSPLPLDKQLRQRPRRPRQISRQHLHHSKTFSCSPRGRTARSFRSVRPGWSTT